MIQSIFIINKEGETLASVNIGDFEADDALFGGFMSAIQSFSQKMAGDEIKGMEIGQYRLIISRVNENFLVTIHPQGEDSPKTNHHRLLELCKDNEECLTDNDFIKELKEEAERPVTGADKASEWAEKML
jgi:hypothetical protein